MGIYEKYKDFWVKPRNQGEIKHLPNAVAEPLQLCDHLIAGFDPRRTTLVLGAGCASSRRLGVEVTVYECALHGQCTIFNKGTEVVDPSIKRCIDCADYTTQGD